VLSIHEAANQPTVISRLMIDRYHSNVDWEVGEIICKVTQLCPHSLQPSEEGNVGVLAHVGWGSGFVFNHKDRPSMARP